MQSRSLFCVWAMLGAAACGNGSSSTAPRPAGGEPDTEPRRDASAWLDAGRDTGADGVATDALDEASKPNELDASNDGRPNDAAPRPEARPPITDAAPYHPERDEAGACEVETLGLGTRDLAPTDATPKPFAEAFQQEVAEGHGPGPLLLQVVGLRATDPALRRIRMGAPAQSAATSLASFDGRAAELPFELNDRALEVGPASESFSLRFGDDTTVRLPVVRVHLQAVFTPYCEAIEVKKLALTIPRSSGNEPFHGSTVAELMEGAGPPDGSTSDGWTLELAGYAQPLSIDEGDKHQDAGGRTP